MGWLDNLSTWATDHPEYYPNGVAGGAAPASDPAASATVSDADLAKMLGLSSLPTASSGKGAYGAYDSHITDSQMASLASGMGLQPWFGAYRTEGFVPVGSGGGGLFATRLDSGGYDISYSPNAAGSTTAFQQSVAHDEADQSGWLALLPAVAAAAWTSFGAAAPAGQTVGEVATTAAEQYFNPVTNSLMTYGEVGSVGTPGFMSAGGGLTAGGIASGAASFLSTAASGLSAASAGVGLYNAVNGTNAQHPTATVPGGFSGGSNAPIYLINGGAPGAQPYSNGGGMYLGAPTSPNGVAKTAGVSSGNAFQDMVSSVSGINPLFLVLGGLAIYWMTKHG